MKLDLNADVGEGMASDAALLGIVSSANIACAAHAGDESVMRQAVAACLQNGVGIGAHPGYADRENFGRLPQALTQNEVIALVADQTRLLERIALQGGGKLRHVKPHGALSNQAMHDFELAQAIAEAIASVSPQLIFLAPSGSAMAQAGREAGLVVVQEIFADRAYDDQGFLVPRNLPGAVLHDASHIADRLLNWLKTGKIMSASGRPLALEAQSVCVHGDTPESVAIALHLQNRLLEAGVTLAPF
ncbi:putative lactam utilization protein, UPF0271 family [Rhodospirillaceae bacterium LM-1]|nr:putative lactam utilization protein, UPF0271 family [Rhodospirillaceae bacterium LM-1]